MVSMLITQNHLLGWLDTAKHLDNSGLRPYVKISESALSDWVRSSVPSFLCAFWGVQEDPHIIP